MSASAPRQLAGFAPSILAADFARLGVQVREVLAAGAAAIHVDVMDGHFVSRLGIGPPVVAALKADVHEAGAFLDVHLMVERPERHIAEFVRAGADMITVHVESTPHIHRVLHHIRDLGCMAGVALTPATPVQALDSVASDADLILCMTVHPGHGGQPFLARSPPRVRALRESAPDATAIGVDGGIDAVAAEYCARVGATLFVAGSAVFRTADPAAAVRLLMRRIADGTASDIRA
jgi:ribulose-phosphate 3-epimerase